MTEIITGAVAEGDIQENRGETQLPDFLREQPEQSLINHELHPTIFRASDSIREEYPYGFTPKIVSIGPYHRNRPSLQAMEATKQRCLHSLIGRTDQSDTLDRYLVAVAVEEARDQYKHLHVGQNEFLQTMVTDAGFIIEFFIKLYKGELEQNQSMTTKILHDLLLLENQIPFHVLQSVFDSSAIFLDEPVKVTLLDLILKGIKSSRVHKYFPGSQGIHHLLHIRYLTLSPDTQSDRLVKSSTSHLASLWSFLGKCFWCLLVNLFRIKVNKRVNPSLPSATELLKCGIVFEVNKNTYMLDIKFNPDRGILTLPLFIINDRTASEFVNLMMFEQGCPSVGNYFTFFITFMGGLIAGPEDARYLKKIGMLDNMLGRDEALASFLNNLGKYARVDSASHYLEPLCNSLISYCSLDHHRCRAALLNEYLKTPWAVIIFSVAISLLVSILWSHYAIINYWFPRL